MQRLIDDISRLELQRIHPLVRSWLSAERIEANVRAAVEDSLRRASESEGPDVVIVPTGAIADGPLITRFRAGSEAPDGSVVRRFIDVEHAAMDAPEIGALAAVRRAVEAAHPDHRGCDVRVYQSSGAALDLREYAGADRGADAGLVVRAGKRLHALPLRLIRRLALPTHHERVAMLGADDLSFYDEYASLYAAMHRERPALANEVPVEPLDQMRLYLEQKTLFHIIIDGQRAGIMAALIDHFAGLHGYRILEKFLYPAYRGRGFAPAAQRRFAEALPDTSGEVLYGFIHPDNVWSSRAARHDGREDIGGYFHLRLWGVPS